MLHALSAWYTCVKSLPCLVLESPFGLDILFPCDPRRRSIKFKPKHSWELSVMLSQPDERWDWVTMGPIHSTNRFGNTKVLEVFAMYAILRIHST